MAAGLFTCTRGNPRLVLVVVRGPWERLGYLSYCFRAVARD
jgi:hypothetical protein